MMSLSFGAEEMLLLPQPPRRLLWSSSWCSVHLSYSVESSIRSNSRYGCYDVAILFHYLWRQFSLTWASGSPFMGSFDTDVFLAIAFCNFLYWFQPVGEIFGLIRNERPKKGSGRLLVSRSDRGYKIGMTYERVGQCRPNNNWDLNRSITTEIGHKETRYISTST